MILYNLYGTTDFKGTTLQDITKRYIIGIRNDKKSIPNFLQYIIKEWEAPEEVAHKVYGSCDYEWVVLLANNIINPYEDWLLKQTELERYITKKYGKAAYDIHHYELNNIIYDKNIMGSLPVTNAQYEYDRNEKKRLINLVYPDMLHQLEQNMSRV